MPKETGEKLIVQNKKARQDYAIEDKYEAGLALTGTELMQEKAMAIGENMQTRRCARFADNTSGA